MPTTPLYTVDNGALRSTNAKRELRASYRLVANAYYERGRAVCDAGGGLTVRPITTALAATGTPLGFMPLTGTTDASGYFITGTPPTAGQFEQGRPTVAILTGGAFRVSDLSGLHANQFTPGGPQNTGWTLNGSITSGILEK